VVAAAQLKVFVVGRVAVESGARLLDETAFPGRQGRLLFAYLVAEQGRLVPRDELADVLWPGAPPASWETGVTVVVSKLRRALADDGIAVTNAFGCYRVDLPEGTWVDLAAATAAVTDAENALVGGDADEARAAAEQAVLLLERSFLPEEEGAWVERMRHELSDVRGRAIGTLVDACLRSGAAVEATAWAKQAVVLAPFRESGYRRLMEAHAAAGNRAEALRVYEQCRHLLAEELGAYPSPETDAIYRRLLAVPAASAAPEPPPRAGNRDAVEGSRPARRGGRARLVVPAAGAILVAGVALASTTLLVGSGTHPAAAQVSADSVALVQSATGRARGSIPIGAAPSGLAAGDGSIWVADINGKSVSRLDPLARVRIQTVGVGDAPAGVAFGGGFLWVANGQDGTVSKIDPRTESMVDTIHVGTEPAGIALEGGHVWVANSGDGTVTEIREGTDAVVRFIPVDQSADGIAAGFGSIWVTSLTTGAVTRVDPRTASRTRISAGTGADAIAVGDGSVWVANRLDDTVTRIDPGTNDVRALISVGDGPSGITVTSSGVWVSDELAGTLSRIDPSQNKVVQTVRLGIAPEGIVSSGGSLYVTLGASDTEHRGGTLKIELPAGTVTTADPARAYTPEQDQVVVMTNDGLVGYRRTGGTPGTQLVPDLAIALPAPLDGGRTYTFRLRPGIHYSDGALVRPQDFRRAIERTLLLDRGGYWTRVVGASACLIAPRRPCDLSHGIVTRRGAGTVTFHLTAPDPDFLDELAQTSAFAVPAGTPLHPRGPVPATGPYRITSFDPKRGLRLVRNPWFREWSPAAQPAGNPDAIVETFTGTPNRDVASVLDGSDDLVEDLGVAKPSASVLRRLRTQDASRLHDSPWMSTWFLVLNTRIAPFDDVRARQALNYAIDRARLRDLTLGIGPLTCQILPPDFDGYTRYCPYTARPTKTGTWHAPDLARARRLVHASGTAGQRVTLWMPKWIHFDAAAGRYVVSVLDELGYKARFRYAADPYPIEDKLRLQLGFYAWSPGFAAPSGFIQPGLSCSSYQPHNPDNENTAEFCDRSIDREINRAQSIQAVQPEVATKLWTRIDHQLTDQAPWVPFANGTVLELQSRRVGNYQYNPQWGTLLDQLWIV
jgi:peptide/nickel transport system substrate-binding protein